MNPDASQYGAGPFREQPVEEGGNARGNDASAPHFLVVAVEHLIRNGIDSNIVAISRVEKGEPRRRATQPPKFTTLQRPDARNVAKAQDRVTAFEQFCSAD
jgi:hypothetical protein